MKRIFFLATMFAIVSSAFSQEYISVEPLTIPQGKTAEMLVNFNFNEDHEYVSYQFNVELPDGLSLVADEYGKASITLADNQPKALFNIDFLASNGIVKVYSSPSTKIDGASGLLVRIPVKADESLEIGTELNGKLKDVEFTKNTGAVRTPFADANIAFTIGDPSLIPDVVLDENSTKAPENATDVVVKVNRTITAGNWSTICLPFAMTADQVKAAFGNDVALGDFTSWSSEEDGDGNIVKINIGFTSVSAIAENHPYIIKVSSAVSEFTVNGVEIAPEDEPSVQVGKKKAEKGFMIGSYVSETVVPENNLFLSGGNYWYSNGSTKMKAFRAYFELADDLTNKSVSATARVKMSITDGDGNTTNIDPRTMQTIENGKVYNMNGQYVGEAEDANSLPKGVYIVNGKKKVIK